MGFIHLLICSMQGSKAPNAQIPLAAKPGALPAPFACFLGVLCGTALMPWSPSDRRSELVLSPIFAEPGHAGCSIPVPGAGTLQPSRR